MWQLFKCNAIAWDLQYHLNLQYFMQKLYAWTYKLLVLHQKSLLLFLLDIIKHLNLVLACFWGQKNKTKKNKSRLKPIIVRKGLQYSSLLEEYNNSLTASLKIFKRLTWISDLNLEVRFSLSFDTAAVLII